MLALSGEDGRLWMRFPCAMFITANRASHEHVCQGEDSKRAAFTCRTNCWPYLSVDGVDRELFWQHVHPGIILCSNRADVQGAFPLQRNRLAPLKVCLKRGENHRRHIQYIFYYGSRHLVKPAWDFVYSAKLTSKHRKQPTVATKAWILK